MRSNGLWKLIVVLLGVLVVASCGEGDESARTKARVTAEDVKKEAKEALQTAMAFTEQQREAYSDRLGAKLDDFDAKIRELDAKADTLDERARAELKARVEELKESQTLVARNFEEMKTVSGEAWKELKPKVDAALEDLKRAYEEARSRIE